MKHKTKSYQPKGCMNYDVFQFFVIMVHRDVIHFQPSHFQLVLHPGQFLYFATPLFQQIHPNLAKKQITSALMYEIHAKMYLS